VGPTCGAHRSAGDNGKGQGGARWGAAALRLSGRGCCYWAGAQDGPQRPTRCVGLKREVGRGEGAQPFSFSFFLKQISPIFFLSSNKVNQTQAIKIKQNKCSGMNAFNHVSILYFILFIFL